MNLGTATEGSKVIWTEENKEDLNRRQQRKQRCGRREVGFWSWNTVLHIRALSVRRRSVPLCFLRTEQG